MNSIKIGTIVGILLVMFVLAAIAYVAGAAAASDGSKADYSGVLSQLRSGSETDLVNKSLKMLQRYYFKEITDEDKDLLVYGAITGMFDVLHREPFNDQFSNFYNPELFKDLEAQTTGEYAGVGILMGLTTDGMYPEVVTVFPGTPAEEAGVRENDVIVQVDGEEAFGMILPQVASKIKGKEGTTVTLGLYRPDDDEFFDVEIERRLVEYSTVSDSEMLANGVGIIKVNSFGEQTSDDFKAALDDLMAQGMQALIVDLRNNSGGIFGESIDLANFFLRDGEIVKVMRRDESDDIMTDPETAKYDIPLVILMNSASASASEILTGALQDNGRAIVVGERSFGKGVIQQVHPLDSDQETGEPKSALAITIGQYRTPNGTDIHGKGIDPNVWYDINNQLQDDPELSRMSDLIEKKRDELRELRSQMTSYIREHDAERDKAIEVAMRLAAGEVVEDVPQLVIEQENMPLSAIHNGEVPVPDNGGGE